MSRPRRHPARRRPSRRRARRPLLVVVVAVVLGGAFVAALILRAGRAPAPLPFRLPTAAVTTPTAEVDAAERARLDGLLHDLASTPHAPDRGR